MAMATPTEGDYALRWPLSIRRCPCGAWRGSQGGVLEQLDSRVWGSVPRYLLGYVEETVQISGSYVSKLIYRRGSARYDGRWWLQQRMGDRRSERWNLARWRELES